MKFDGTLLQWQSSHYNGKLVIQNRQINGINEVIQASQAYSMQVMQDN